jgi:hypothetical protein
MYVYVNVYRVNLNNDVMCSEVHVNVHCDAHSEVHVEVHDEVQCEVHVEVQCWGAW